MLMTHLTIADIAKPGVAQGIFLHGISVLRLVDFFTVSVRHRAFLQAAVGVATYGSTLPISPAVTDGPCRAAIPSTARHSSRTSSAGQLRTAQLAPVSRITMPRYARFRRRRLARSSLAQRKSWLNV